ncbi:MAG: hypothetical protein U0441_26305 [Polyangiaceae bacterium]
MTSRRFPSLLFVSSLSISLLACGSRSALDGTITASSGGSGGSTTTSTAGAGGATTTTTPTPTSTETLCSLLLSQPPVIATPNGVARRPGLGAVAGTTTVMFGALYAEADGQHARFSTIKDPWTSWPPKIESTMAAPGFVVQDLAMSTGPTNALALVAVPGAVPYLMTLDEFSLTSDPFLSLGSGDILYVAGVEGVSIGAIKYLIQENDEKIEVGSFTPNGLPQSEPPTVCISSKMHAAAAPKSTGFLSAVSMPGDLADICLPMTPAKATRVAIMRYEAPSSPGGSLDVWAGDSFQETEPIQLLAMAPASFGGWVVYQTDGSTSEQMPAILAAPLNTSGYLVDGIPGPFAVSPEGVEWPYVGAAQLAGDALAVAHVETIDPAAPAIVIQVAEPNGKLGPSLTIPTNGAWPTGRIELLPSPEGLSFLVAWETNEATQDRIALARVDCIAPI